MELSTLSFKVDVTELERASKAVGALVQDMSKISAASSQMAKTQAQTEEILSRAAKNYAAARKENAKAADQEIKSIIVADKADQSREKSVRKTTTATQESTKAAEKNVSILQRQSAILEFQTQGWSKGQSSILATAKAAGVAAEEMQSLQKVLETQRKLMGGDPFDKSISGLKSLQNQYTELKEAVRQYNTDSNLTAKQTKEIARDKERLIEKMKVEGASFQDIRSAVRAYNQEYVNLAGQYNKLSNAEADVIKQRKDMVSATNYVTIADQKMSAALQTSNASLDRGATDSLVKYENALRKSGMAQDVVTTKLATYRTQLAQVQAQEMKHAEQHLARMASPQLTDLAVSLYSGQAPLTVLLQQGGQLADGLRLSGVEAEKFGDILKESFYSMIPIIKQVGIGLGGLVTGMAVDAGSALTGFIGEITGITAATEIMKRAIASGGEENFKYIASIQKLGNALSVVAGVFIAAFIAGLVAVGLEYKKILQSESELSVALATSGGALGFSKDQAVQYAQSLQGVGIGTLKAQKAITEFAKAGKVGQENFDAVIKSAVELEKTAGVAIEETAKQFAKLQDAPSKTLTEIAEKTGLVDAATLDLVRSLEQQGEKAEAANVATLAFASANIQAASEVRSNWSPLEVLWNDIKSALGRVKQEIYEITTSNLVVGSMKTVWETFAVTIAEVWFVLKGIGRTIGGVFAMIAAGSPTQAANIWKEMGNDSERLRSEHDKLITSIMNRSDVEGKSFNQNKKQQSDYSTWLSENDKALAKTISKKEQYAIKERQLKKDLESGLINEIKYNEALAGWKKIILGEEKQKKETKTESFFESSMKALRNNTIEAAVANDGLVESQVLLLQIIKDPAFAEMTKIQKIQIMQAGAAAIATEQQAEAVKQLEKAEEFRLKVLGKSEGVGKQYYSDMEALMKYAKTAGWTTEQVEEMTRALYMQTPAWKEHEKALESSRQALNKFNEESIAYQAGTAKTNEELDYRISLLGKTAAEQKILSIEYQREQKIRENAVVLGKKLRDIEEGINKAKKDGLGGKLKEYEDAKVQAIQDSAERERAINRETAVVYAEDLQKEIDAIKSGISDSIVTALFEGGKEGSKKLRQVLVDTLRKKVTIVVDAVVNTLVGNVVGSLFGGAGAGGGSGGGGGGLLGTASNVASLASSGFAGSVIAGYQVASGAAAGAGTIATAAAPTGFGASLGSTLAAIPGWGWAIAAIAALAAIFTKKATPHMGAASTYSAAAGVASGADIYATSGLADTRTYNAEVEKVTSGIAQTLGQTLDATAKSFGKSAGFEISTAFADDTSKDGAWGSLVIKQMGKEVLNWADTQVSKWAPKEFADGEEGMKQYMQAVAVSMRDALLTMDLPGWANEMLEAVGDTPSVENVSQVVAQINAASVALETLRNVLVGFSEYTDVVISSLAKEFGSIENLISLSNAYYDKFYTEEEKQANILKQLTREFGKQNLTLPKNREEYRKLTEAQDLSTEEGRKMYHFLLQLAPTFAEISEGAEAANESFSKLVESAYSALESAVNAQKDILKIQEGIAEEAVNRLKGIFDLLKRNVRELYMQVDSTSGMLASQGRSVIAQALSSGVLPDTDVLGDAISAVRSSIDSTAYVTQFEQDKARLQFAADLKLLQDGAGEQLSVAELTLKAVKEQIEYLDALLENAREQANLALGIQNAVLSVADALAAFTEALLNPDKEPVETNPTGSGGFVIGGGGGGSGAPAKPGSGYYGAGGTEINDPATVAKLDSINTFINTLDWSAGNKEGSAATLANAALTYGVSLSEIAIASGYSLSDVESLIGGQGIPKFANGGVFTNSVVTKPRNFNIGQMGEAGPEAIMPLTSIGGRLGVSAVSSEDNSALAERVASLEVALQAIAVNTSKTNRLLERVTRDGESLITKDYTLA